ncbi:hypothetical protein J6590_088462 [Homalodisca vitripennis]|nr:hypothetical protein J6590_088462 [Homalodisca vitripennis]
MVRASDISPIPKMSEQDLKKHSRSQVAEIITSTRHTKCVENKNRKNAIRPKGDRPMKKKVFRKLWDSSSESNEEEQIVFADDSADDDYEEGDAECLYCTGLFSEDRNGEDWIRCKACSRWSHFNCADVGNAVFVCDFCAKRK